MTIPFAGHEVGAMTPNDAATYEDTSHTNYWDTTYSRCNLVSNGPSTHARSATFTGLSQGSAHFTLIVGLSNLSSHSFHLCRADGTEVVRVAHVSGKMYLEYWNGSIWVGFAGFTITETSRNDFDLTWKTNSATGYLRLYAAGTLAIDSGVVDLSVVPAITNVECMGPQGVWCGSSQIVVSSDATIGWRVGTTYPTGAGTTNTFTTGAYSDVDEITYSDADGLTSDTANQIATFATTSILPAGYAAKGLSVTVRAKRGTTGPQNMQIAIRTHATNYFSPTIALDVGYAAYCYVWETNPNTGAAWTDAEIAAVEIGVKSIA